MSPTESAASSQVPAPQVPLQTSAQIGSHSFQPSTPVISAEDLARSRHIIESVSGLFQSKVVGQNNLFTSLMVALIANGHVLMESVPGLAKTTAAQTLADSIKASFHRIQCTPDVLPSDIIGSQVYNYTKGTFETQLGPVHANFVLLDEINRSSAKTQSAMLEAMQERQTTIGGVKYQLPHPFVVLATQNPIEQEGTYELPEAQMDRFLLKEIITYPTPVEEIEVLNRIENGVLDHNLSPNQSVQIEEIVYVQELTKKVYIDESIKQYIVNIVTATRYPANFIQPELAKYVEFGASPRGSITFMQVAKALALLNGRDYVTPDDVKLLRYSVLRHRIILNFEAVADNVHHEAIIDAIFAAIVTP